MRFRIITPNGVHSLGLFLLRLLAHRGNLDHQGDAPLDLGHVGSGGGGRQRNAVSLDQNVVFADGFASIRRVRPGVLASQRGLGKGGIHGRSRPVDLAHLVPFRQQQLVQMVQDAGVIPLTDY